MEDPPAPASELTLSISEGNSFKQIVPYLTLQEAARRVSHLGRSKPLDKKDALQAVKVDPAVLEAQVTVTTGSKEETTPLDAVAVAQKKLKEASYPSFEEVVSMQQAALLGLSPQQLELLMAFVDTLRRQRQHSQRYLECAFCKNNGSPAAWYSSHALRDRRRVRCPVLRALRCRRCGASGDRAHTDKYCPLNVLYDYWSYP